MATATQTVTGTQPAPAVIGHNSQAAAEAAKQAWFDECEEYGKAAGKGATSTIGWMGGLVERSYRDEIDVEDTEESVKRFQAGKAKAAAALGKRYIAVEGKADKVRLSEARKMIKLGKLAVIRSTNNGGLGVFHDALKIIGDSPNIKGELTKLMLKVASEQLRLPDVPLDADHIRQVLSPKEGEDPAEGDYLIKAKKNIELAAKVAQWDAHKRAAVSSITQRIEQIGYKTAQQRVAEQKAKDAARKAKARAKKKL